MLVSKVDTALVKLNDMESQMKTFDVRLQDLENGVSFMEQEYCNFFNNSELTCASQPDPVLAQYLKNYYQWDQRIQVSVTYL